MALAVTGVFSQLAPSSAGEFGLDEYRVEQLSPEVVGLYVESAERLGARATGVCDAYGDVEGVTTRVRAVSATASGAAAVGLQPGELPPAGGGELAISAMLSDLLDVSAGEAMALNGAAKKVVNTGVSNPSAVSDPLVVVPLASAYPTSICVMLLDRDVAFETWAAVTAELGLDPNNDLPGSTYTRSEYESATQRRTIWSAGTLLALVGGGAVSASIWGLLMPGMARNGMALVVLGVGPKAIRAVALRWILIFGIVSAGAGAALGFGIATAMAPWIAAAFDRALLDPVLPFVLVAVTFALSVTAALLVALLASRRLGSRRLLTDLAVPGSGAPGLPKWHVISAVTAVVGIFVVIAVDAPAVRGLGCLAIALALWDLVLTAAARRRVHLSGWGLSILNVSRSRSRLLPAIAVLWFAAGLGLFTASFAAIEFERATIMPALPPSSALVAAEWDWGRPSGVDEPTQGISDRQLSEVLAAQPELRAVEVRRAGDPSLETALYAPVFDSSGSVQALPLYLATPELTSLMGIEAPAEAEAFWAGDGNLTVQVAATNILVMGVDARRYRDAPAVFIRPAALERRSLGSFVAAHLLVGPEQSLLGALEELRERGVDALVSGSPVVSRAFLLSALGFALAATLLAALTHRVGLREVVEVQASQLESLGVSDHQVRLMLRRSSIFAALVALPALLAVGALPLWLASELADPETVLAFALLTGWAIIVPLIFYVAALTPKIRLHGWLSGTALSKNEAGSL